MKKKGESVNWSEKREKIISLLNQHKTVPEIALELEVPEFDLKQYLHRTRLFVIDSQKRNLANEIIMIYTRGYPDYFKPGRNFFISTGIRQKRWWALYRGEMRMTEDEYKSVTTHLGITLQEAFEARQLNWVEEIEK